jgi:hypothetical protein
VPYTTKDVCFNNTCAGSCTSCGELTYCHANLCLDACTIYFDKEYAAADAGCLGEDNTCWMCHCYNLDHQGVDMTNKVCVPKNDKHEFCNDAWAKDLKAKIDSTDWLKMANDQRQNCQGASDYP